MPILWSDSALIPMIGGPINRLGSIFDRVFGEDTSVVEAWNVVPMAMWEDHDRVYVEAELPGMSDEDLDITIENGKLSIRGERKLDEGRTYLYQGRCYGRFERVIALPEGVAADDAQAELKDGVLTITLLKKAEATPKKIALKMS